MTYDPRFLEIDRWASLTSALLLPYGNVAVTATEDGWQTWGEAVRQIPAVAAKEVPGTQYFDDWRLWAHRLNEGLRLIGL